MKVNAFTGGVNVPSARYRIRQLIPFLRLENIDVHELISMSGVYPPDNKFKRPIWAIQNVLENAYKVLIDKESDVVLFQRELFSKFKTFETFYSKPKLFDVDDSIHLYRQGVFTKKIALKMDGIICGNAYLANWYSQWNKNVTIIPTAVNVSLYDIISEKSPSQKIQIIWSGSSSGLKFLYDIEHALQIVLDRNSNVQLIVVSNKSPQFTLLKENQYKYIRWTPEIEFSSIKQADIGIMPILDDDWGRGKCSYKMLSYMAAKLPVVVSPYGMNFQVLKEGEIGFGVKNFSEWIDAIEELIQSNILRKKLGENGYNLIKKKYDVKVVSSMLAQSIYKVK